ncbi:DUF4253 domain-containing protein [Lentzea tibetensis]|uniref:DUF4253 domain-containing protein n=1 Tax=Lentzea tibetensis TaxID=2591470 RepID=A0A563EUY9_9PSEU|nr:DUF4253 domain-containing protein [Lentzea tibetensis]TWP51537.1 DUF4253 domain-containing protein [Lentzea tibetensis]
MLSELLRAVPLPPGRIVHATEGAPAFWLSDDPVDAALWRRLDHDGLWPLVLTTSEVDDPGRPWASGEVWHAGNTAPENHDPEQLMAGWWHGLAEPDPDEEELVTDPFGRQWPGLAPPHPQRHDPGEAASRLAESLMTERARLGLVAARRGSDALVAMGWKGPTNYVSDIGRLASVLRSWEDRFGARVVGLESHALLHVSVAAPPVDHEQALRVAAEHFTFCPENVRTSSTIGDYAEELVGSTEWGFWWD